MITKFTIYGERCSGTNYLENLMTNNFDINVTWEYGWKHFFGFQDLSNSDNTLFIGIIRNPYDWFNSLHWHKHHLPKVFFRSVDNFLKKRPYPLTDISYPKDAEPFFSAQTKHSDFQKPNLHIYEHRPYHNLFELRRVKNHFLFNDMPKLVKNYILIRHEDLIYDFENTMFLIASKGIEIKKNITFPVNIKKYYTNKVDRNKDFVLPKRNSISKERINQGIDLQQEQTIFNGYLL